MTDGREVTEVNDFECWLLPTDAQFLTALRKRFIFVPDQLKGVDVTFAYLSASSATGRG